MLCLVFAVAGPVMPGAGDVSTMDPTMAYGAAPNMLVFAPDGGAGFDLGGQDSFVDFLTSWNTTIAGPLGTSRAQNVIPPNPKGPMAVRATSRPRCVVPGTAALRAPGLDLGLSLFCFILQIDCLVTVRTSKRCWEQNSN